MNEAETFCAQVAAVLRRFFAQNAQPAPGEAEIAALAGRLWALVAERGLPPPLAPGEGGAPGELPEAVVAPLVTRALGELSEPLLVEAVRQLVKACFYPAFTTCRDSFCAAAPEGACRRQEIARVRKRVSGSHCVDCPYWLGLDADAHESLLRAHWRGDPDELRKGRGVFLPDDFRALRRWIRAKATEVQRD